MFYYLQMLETPEDQSKFEILYNHYRGLMYHVAFQILQNEEDAEDAVHQAFVKVAENFHKVDDPICTKTKSYLVIIVERKAIDICRLRTKRQEVPFNEEIVGLQVEYTGSFDLAKCFAKLPANYRNVLALKYRHGYTNKEVAKILGLTEVNVCKLDQRAKAKLREICEEEGVAC